MSKILLPNTISTNTIKCYQIEESFSCSESRISCQNIGQWCKSLPRSLKALCIQSIADNWEDFPKLDEICSPEDKCMLLNILPTNLPLELVVSKVNDNIYFKKCAIERWYHLIPINIKEKNMFIFNSTELKKEEPLENTEIKEYSIKNDDLFTESKNWKEHYLENHMREYLENLKPEDYDPEQVKIICDICAPFVKSLHIEELMYSNNHEGITRIPIGSVLTGLPCLQELSVCFKQRYIGFENFKWGVVQLPTKDIKNLAKGLKKIQLLVLRIINSGIEGNECIPILKSVENYDNLRVLDFSYCSLDDEGTISLCRFSTAMNIRELLLVDNNIGDEGAEAVAFILHRPDCTLEYLNVKMNPIGSKSGNLILKSLLFNKKLKILDISACNIRVKEIISEVLKGCPTLEELNLSNNPIGNEVGNIILNGMKYNKLMKLDLRMCLIHSEIQQKINDKMREVSRLNAISCVEKRELAIEFSEKCRHHFENHFEND